MQGFFMNNRKLNHYIFLLLCITPFFIGVNGPFLLDDGPNLLAAAKAQSTWNSWYQAIFGNESGALRRPISNLTFLLNSQLLGNDPFFFKLVNIILHGINGLLVYFFTQSLISLINKRTDVSANKCVALIASAIWIIHPIQVSTVLYVVQRMTELSALFMLLSLILGVKFFQLRQANLKQGIYYLLGVAGLAFMGLLAKENAVLVPLMLLTVWLCLPSGTGVNSSIGGKVFCSIGIFAPVAGMLVFTLFMLPRLIESYEVREFTLLERVLTQPYVLWHYLSSIFFPNIKIMGLFLDDITLRSPAVWSDWLGLVTVLVCIPSAFFFRKKYPLIAFSVLWYFACHALESTIIPLEIAFEHRNYLALIGPALLIAYGFVKLGVAISTSLWRIVIGALFITLFVATASRSHQWSSIELFVRSEALHHPNSLRALNSIAAFDYQLGNFDSAVRTTQKIEALYPDNFWANALKLNIIACGKSKESPDFNKLLEIIRRNPAQPGIAPSLLQVVGNILKQKCEGISNSEFENFIEQAIVILEGSDQKLAVERLYVLRSMLAEVEADKKRQEQMLLAAVAANPEGTNAKFDLAYFYLNTGNLTKAQEITIQLQKIIAWGTDKTRVDELQMYIETEIATLLKADKD
jgi:hypothetical protein